MLAWVLGEHESQDHIVAIDELSFDSNLNIG